jgi:hypothetical protein
VTTDPPPSFTAQGAPRFRGAALDAALVVLALAFGAFTLGYPFGRDQATHHYIGREWLLHGSIPFRDLVDHKPPGVHLLFGVPARILGDRMWPIRVVEFGFLVALAFSASSLLTHRTAPRPPHLTALCFLTATICHLGFFDFWHTAQPDFHGAVIGFGAAALVHRIERPWLATASGGLLAGLALTMKPVSLVFVIAAAAVWVARVLEDEEQAGRLKRLAIGLGVFAATALVIPGALAGYFASRGALDDLVFWIVQVNRYYLEHEATPGGFWTFMRLAFATMQPLAGFYLALAAIRLATAPRQFVAQHVPLLILLLFAFGGVIAQRKFFLYHWGAAVPPAVGLLGRAYLDLREWIVPRASRARMTLAFTASLLMLYAMSSSAKELWWARYRAAVALLFGRIQRSDYARGFDLPAADFQYGDSLAVGEWLRANTGADANVAVRGFEPQVYAISGRRYAGRFFWTNFITDERRAFKRDEWLAEEREMLLERPPDVAVTITDRAEVIGTDWYQPLGYAEVARFGKYRVLTRR